MSMSGKTSGGLPQYTDKDKTFLRSDLNTAIKAIENAIGGAGSVSSVNGKVGAVILKAEDIEDNNANTLEEDITALENDIEDLDTNKQDKNDSTLETISKQVVGAINELNSNKQNKTDNTLTTTSKQVVGAINELNSDKQDNLTEDNGIEIDSSNNISVKTDGDTLTFNSDKEVIINGTIESWTINFDDGTSETKKIVNMN